MRIRKVIWTLASTAVIFLATPAVQAQSNGRKSWMRNDPVSASLPAAQDRHPGFVQHGGWEAAAREMSGSERKEVPTNTLDGGRASIVGSWLGTSGEGNKLLFTFHSDGTAHGSVQTEVSTNPELGVLTPGHGVWKYLGGRKFGVTVLGILYDINTGALMGTLEARVVLTLDEAGDQLSGTDRVAIFDPEGNLVFAAPPGNTSYARIRFGPIE